MRIVKKVLKFFLYSNNRIRLKVNFLVSTNKNKDHKIMRLCIQENLRKKHHILIGRDAIMGSLDLLHPHNIVIGRYVEIGYNCKIYHDVTIGQNLNRFPKIGDNVIIYTGAKVIGGVTVGNNAIIGANAVVTSDVPENAIVAGIPA